MTPINIKSPLFKFNEENIYIGVSSNYNSIYKYHKSVLNHSFIALNSSNCHSSGIHNNQSKAFESYLESNNKNIYEFFTMESMIIFLVNTIEHKDWKK